MKTILVVNTREKECAVWQYGQNLCQALRTNRTNSNFIFAYCEPTDLKDLRDHADLFMADAILYNWHPSQGGFLKDAPFDVGRPVKSLCVFHELPWERSAAFDGLLYSGLENPVLYHAEWQGRVWHNIPLLLPLYEPSQRYETDPFCPVIGVNGYGGAHANLVVERVIKEWQRAVIRLHLPSAHYGDADGRYARIFADKCRDLAKDQPGIVFKVEHEWLPQDRLLDWLSTNDLNVYLRPTDVPWHGVSAAMCAALAVKRPMATNRNPSFRHLWDVNPSILVEDRSLKQILATGTKPLEPIWQENSTEKFVARIEEILGYLLA